MIDQSKNKECLRRKGKKNPNQTKESTAQPTTWISFLVLETMRLV